jgi:hypothetical protein
VIKSESHPLAKATPPRGESAALEDSQSDCAGALLIEDSDEQHLAEQVTFGGKGKVFPEFGTYSSTRHLFRNNFYSGITELFPKNLLFRNISHRIPQSHLKIWGHRYKFTGEVKARSIVI